MRSYFMIFVLLLSACAGNSFAQKQDLAPVTTAEQCKAQGGVWRKAGMAGQTVCDLPTKDSGKVCSDSSECESICIVPNATANSPIGKPVQGHCYQSKLLLGTCLARVTKGISEPVLCID